MKTLLKIYIAISFSIFISVNCKSGNSGETLFYRNEMRTFVISLSSYARSIKPGFIVIPQNGAELITLNGEHDGTPAVDYLNAINGQGQEDFNYGYDGDGIATTAEEKSWLKGFLDLALSNGIKPLITDYCGNNTQIDTSYTLNDGYNYTGFATTDRELSSIPAYPSNPNNNNTSNISSLSDAKNFLYLLNSENFSSKTEYLNELKSSSHDLLIIDLYYKGSDILTPAEITELKTKSGGGTRLVIAYMSIGEAEDYRYYWQSSWDSAPPAWLAEENPDWEGNYKVRYWFSQWQYIIYGNDDSYLKKILDAGFDGVYLDIIDAYEYFE